MKIVLSTILLFFILQAARAEVQESPPKSSLYALLMDLKDRPLPNEAAIRIISMVFDFYVYQTSDGFYSAKDVTKKLRSEAAGGGTDWAHEVMRIDLNDMDWTKNYAWMYVHEVEDAIDTAENLKEVSDPSRTKTSPSISFYIQPEIQLQNRAPLLTNSIMTSDRSLPSSLRLMKINTLLVSSLFGFFGITTFPSILLGSQTKNILSMGPDQSVGMLLVWLPAFVTSVLVSHKFRARQLRRHPEWLQNFETGRPNDMAKKFVLSNVITGAVVGNGVGACIWMVLKIAGY